MHRSLSQLAVSNLLWATLLFAQTSGPGAHSIPGTEDRAASYHIYSSPIPLGKRPIRHGRTIFGWWSIRPSRWCRRINPACRDLHPQQLATSTWV